jgi:hypothetical protein
MKVSAERAERPEASGTTTISRSKDELLDRFLVPLLIEWLGGLLPRPAKRGLLIKGLPTWGGANLIVARVLQGC